MTMTSIRSAQLNRSIDFFASILRHSTPRPSAVDLYTEAIYRPAICYLLCIYAAYVYQNPHMRAPPISMTSIIAHHRSSSMPSGCFSLASLSI